MAAAPQIGRPLVAPPPQIGRLLVAPPPQIGRLLVAPAPQIDRTNGYIALLFRFTEDGSNSPPSESPMSSMSREGTHSLNKYLKKKLD